MNRINGILKQLLQAGSSRNQRGWAILLFLISAITFSLTIRFHHPDIPLHNLYLKEWYDGDPDAKLYSVYYLFLMLFSFFQNNLFYINSASVFLLSMAVLLKFRITCNLLRLETGNEIEQEKKLLISYSAVALMLCLAQNLIYRFSATMILGYIPVNVWHNSTTIFLFPFSLLLFYVSYRNIVSENKFSVNDYVLITGLTILTIMIKPSFYFAFAIAFPAAVLLQYGITKRFFMAIASIAVSSLAVLLIFKIVYPGSNSSVAIHPFASWRFWSSNIPLSWVASVLFPLLFVCLNIQSLKNDALLGYAWLMFGSAMLVYIFISEDGPRAIHGNFMWQTIICNYILFMATCISFYKKISLSGWAGLKDRLVAGVFLMHVFTGIVYLIKLPHFGFR